MAVINGKNYPAKIQNSEYNSLLLRYVLDEERIRELQELQKKKLQRLNELLED